jgi:hypothetical protein
VPIVREKIVKYSQFHVNDALRARLADHLPFAQYDGAAEMWAKSYDDLMEVKCPACLSVERVCDEVFTFAFTHLHSLLRGSGLDCPCARTRAKFSSS